MPCMTKYVQDFAKPRKHSGSVSFLDDKTQNPMNASALFGGGLEACVVISLGEAEQSSSRARSECHWHFRNAGAAQLELNVVLCMERASSHDLTPNVRMDGKLKDPSL